MYFMYALYMYKYIMYIYMENMRNDQFKGNAVKFTYRGSYSRNTQVHTKNTALKVEF